MKKKVLQALLISTITLSATALPMVASADTVDNKVSVQDKKINELKEKENAAAKELAGIQSSISSIKAEASQLQTEQASLGKEITKLSGEIKNLEQRIAKRDAAIKEQARSAQVDSANSTMLDVVMESDSISDAVTRVMAASKLVSANNDLMAQQKEDMTAVETKKDQTETKSASLQKNAVELEAKKGELEDQELQQTIVVSGISAEKETEQSKKDAFLKEKQEAEKKREEQTKAAEKAAKPVESISKDTKSTTGSTSTGEGTASTTTPVQPTPAPDQGDQGQQPSNPTPAPNPTPAQPSNPAPSANGNAIVAEAYKHIGKPYVWGAKGPGSFDCSGFTSYVYRNAAGREIGGWTVPQESAGSRVSFSSLQAGDLLFWGGAGSTYHVAIYVGGGQYIHAPSPGQSVMVQSMSAWSPDFAVRVN
ncbi:C40 family peptidase [Vagococcus silagei]|uniref:C40 family peptidase n=1 Tax=Vagococcus silagei TaxID=2508885 RepID=UPI0013A681AC|nr:C40 family peptidase [Vagococcus silagei]